jgi:hypothetical protein
MPKRQIRKSPEYGLIYEEVATKLPIQGPKTLEKTEEEAEINRETREYFATKPNRIEIAQVNQKWLLRTSVSRTPNKNQRVRLFYLDEQLLVEQLSKLEERYNPAPFVWTPPEDEPEQEFEDPDTDCTNEDSEDEITEDCPLVQTEKTQKKSKGYFSSKKSWSQLPWQALEEAFEQIREGNPVRKKKKKMIPFILSLSDAYHLGMGGNLVPLQQMLIWEQKPLSPTGLQPEDAEDEEVDPEEEERKQRSAKFKKRKEKLWRDMNSDGFKEKRASLQAEIDFEHDQPTSWQVDQELKEDPDIRKYRLMLGKYWENNFYYDRKARKLAVMWFLLRSKGGWNPRIWRNLWEKMIEDEEFGQDFKAAHEVAVAGAIRNANRREWDEFMKNDIQKLRKKDDRYDYKLALLLCYNEEIDDEEAERRTGMLDSDQTDQAFEEVRAWRDSP